MTSTLKVGLVGLGKMGKNHLRVLEILKNIEVVFVFDVDKKVLGEVTKRSGIKGYSKLEEINIKYDAVIIATPTTTHAELIFYFGKFTNKIFVEKPLASNYKEGLSVLKYAKKRGTNIQVGFIERFNPAVIAVKDILNNIQKPILIDFFRTNKVSNRITDVDVVTDLMIHDIDLALYLNGPVESVSAYGNAENGNINLATAVLTHKNKTISRIIASKITEKKVRLIQVTSNDIFIDCDLLKKEIQVHRQTRVSEVENRPYIITSVEDTVEVKPQEALLSELITFTEICTEKIVTFKNITIPDCETGIESLKICEKIRANILKR